MDLKSSFTIAGLLPGIYDFTFGLLRAISLKRFSSQGTAYKFMNMYIIYMSVVSFKYPLCSLFQGARNKMVYIMNIQISAI